MRGVAAVAADGEGLGLLPWVKRRLPYSREGKIGMQRQESLPIIGRSKSERSFSRLAFDDGS